MFFVDSAVRYVPKERSFEKESNGLKNRDKLIKVMELKRILSSQRNKMFE